jgi:hypothetical protein
MLKHLIRSGNISSSEENGKEYTNVKRKFEIFWKYLFVKLKSSIKEILFEKEKRSSQPNDWEAWISELIVEVFVVSKSDNHKNFCTGGERSSLKNIGTIFIVLQLHWSNGDCISSSSSDDG